MKIWMTMNINSILIRDNDKKIFKVKFVSHWSSIVSDDGEIDTVKHLCGHEYVSAVKGFGYVLQEE